MNVVAVAGERTDEGSIRDIRAALRGPVMKVLKELVPELGRVRMESAYDRVMGSVYVLDRCFLAFRRHRERFRHVLVDARGTPIAEGSGMLACGRTLDQVVAMIVCTSARRYFHRHVGEGAATSGAMSLRRLFSRKVKGPAAILTGAAEELYACIRDYLRHDWQVRLVPAYATLTPAQVGSLGERLLSLDTAVKLYRALGLEVAGEPVLVPDPASRRDAWKPAASDAALDALRDKARVKRAFPTGERRRKRANAAAGGEERAAPAVRAASASSAVSKARADRAAMPADLLTLDGRRLRPDGFASALQGERVRALLGKVDDAQAVLGSVGGTAGRILVEQLGLDRERLAVLLLGAHRTMGSDRFLRVFGSDADPALATRLVNHARAAAIGPRTPLPELMAFTTRLFGRVSAAPPRPIAIPT